MFYYISQAVFVLVALFLLIIMAIESSSRYGKIIGIVIATAIVTALCVGGYTQYKYNTASVAKADNIEVVDKKSHDYRLEKDNRKIQRQKIQFA